MNTSSRGAKAEQTVERFLNQQGLRLVTRNYSARTGEIDLIMEDQNELVFIEVRLRNNPNFASAEESIDSRKQKRIIRTAERYLQSHDDARWHSYRFDVVSVSKGINWIKHAFTLD